MSFSEFLLGFILLVLGGTIALMSYRFLSRTEKRAWAHRARAFYRTFNESWVPLDYRNKDKQYDAAWKIIRENPVVISERTEKLNRWRVRIGLILVIAGVLIFIIYLFVVTKMSFSNPFAIRGYSDYAPDYYSRRETDAFQSQLNATPLPQPTSNFSSGCMAINQLDSYHLFHVRD